MWVPFDVFGIIVGQFVQYKTHPAGMMIAQSEVMASTVCVHISTSL